MLTSHINSYFIIDETKYDVENFNVGFSQSIDFKGQPQHEVRGGQLTITLSHAGNNDLYLWAKTATLRKNGQILFQTDLGITVLRINFINGYCINLAREINAFNGTRTVLIISPENLTLNGIEHENFWSK